MKPLSPAALRMLKDCLDDGEPTDFNDFANRSGVSAFGWGNRERCLTALIRKGLLNDDLKLTDAGIAALGRN